MLRIIFLYSYHARSPSDSLFPQPLIAKTGAFLGAQTKTTPPPTTGEGTSRHHCSL